MSTLVKFKNLINSKLSSTDIENGSLIAISDLGDLYLDFDDRRVGISSIIYLTSESERELILVPLSKLYYVRETNLFWYYNDGWIQLNQQILVDLTHDPSYENVPSSKAVVNYVDLKLNSIIRTKLTKLPTPYIDDQYKYYTWDDLYDVQILDSDGSTVIPQSYIRSVGSKTTTIKLSLDIDDSIITKWRILLKPIITESDNPDVMIEIIDFPSLLLNGDEYIYEWDGIYNIQIINDEGELVLPDSYLRKVDQNKTIIKFNSEFDVNITSNWKVYISSFN